jgi:hypothetical protein
MGIAAQLGETPDLREISLEIGKEAADNPSITFDSFRLQGKRESLEVGF